MEKVILKKMVKKVTKKSAKKSSQFVIVRTYSAGVHVGYLSSPVTGKVIRLSKSHRIWRWRGANTLSELSLVGADFGWTRISEQVDSIVITEAIEIIPVLLDSVVKNLSTPRWPKD